jgi:hypothetical protein
MNLDDLWIGDTVRIVSNGKTGTYEGHDENGKLTLKENGKIFYAHISEVEAVDEDMLLRKAQLEEDEEIEFKDPVRSLFFDTTIDLHIEVLKPDLKHARAEQILNYQLRAAKYYIEKAKFLRKHMITIIHGKGAGVLKMEIENLVKSIEETDRSISVNNGGALEVYFKY